MFYPMFIVKVELVNQLVGYFNTVPLKTFLKACI